MLSRITNIVGWIGFAVVLAAAAIRVGNSFGYSAYDKYASPLAIAGLVLLVIYILGQWREIAKMFSGRQARYGTLTGVSVLVVLAILVAINYIGSRQHKRWDLTANKQFSLSDQTRTVLQKLESPLHIRVFAEENAFQQYRDKLKEYEYISGKVSSEYIDPDKKPTAAAGVQLQPPGSVTMMLDYKGRSERLTSDNEQDVTTAIIKLVQGTVKKVYFTAGHGEKDPASSDRDGYKAIADSLTHENYSTDKLVLAQAGSVPDDAAVVVIAGPKTDFFPGEITTLKTYLGKQGKLLLELDPPERVDSPPLMNLIALAHDWGMDVGNDIVVDVSGMGQLIGTDASVPVAANYPAHAIVQRFKLLTAYPAARSVTAVSGGVNGHIAQGFVETSQRSWAESDLKGMITTGKVSFNGASGDKQGPITIAAAASAQGGGPAGAASDAPKPETRVVVFGDSDFAANSAIGIQGNRDLFMNTIGWLSQQENLIAIRPKDADDRRLTMTSAQQTNVTWLSLFIIPGLVFFVGVSTWWRRR